MSYIEQKNKKNTPDIAGFLQGLAISIFVILIILFVYVGSIGLYICKIAQANILPDDIHLAPFADTMRDVEQIEVNINVIKEYGMWGLGGFFFQNPISEVSEKVVFDNNEIMKSFYRGLIGNINSCNSSGNYWLYFTQIFNSMTALNNGITNKIFQWMGKTFSEEMIMILYTIITPFLLFGSFFINFWASIWYHLTTIPALFRNKDDNGDWEQPKYIHYFYPIKVFWAVLLMFIIFIPVIGFCIFSTIYAFISPLLIPYHYIDSNTNKPESKSHGFLHFVSGCFSYKKQYILLWISFLLLRQAYQSLGSMYFGAGIIAILGAIFVGLFKQSTENLGKHFSQGLELFTPANISKGKSISIDEIYKIMKKSWCPAKQ